MCIGAETLAIVSAVSGVLSTGMSFMGQMQQQAALGAQANYAAAVARNNAQAADHMATDAIRRGEIAEAAQRRRTQQIIGAQQARLAAQGTDLSGSATDILGDAAETGEFDALTVRSNAAREAYGYKVQANNFAADAIAKSNTSTSSLGAGASLLAGASSLADKWHRFQYGSGGTGLGGWGSAGYMAAASPSMLSGGHM